MSIEIENGSVCVVASTLPVGFINNLFNDLKIRRIVVMKNHLASSYRGFVVTDPTIKLVVAPSGILAQFLFLLRELTALRFKKQSLVMFHECCLPVLDTLTLFIKPKGYLFPQVSLSGSEEIGWDEFRNRKMKAFLSFFFLTSRFSYYKSAAVDAGPITYEVSLKNYPKGIVKKSIGFSRERSIISPTQRDKPSNKLLFITGQTLVSNDSQFKLFNELSAIAGSLGFSCSIKDHPNPAFRLGFYHESALTIDPTVPAELVDNNFDWVVGVSSTALLAYDDHAISVVDLFDDMQPIDKNFCKLHFRETSPDNRIQYPSSVDEFANLLKQGIAISI